MIYVYRTYKGTPSVLYNCCTPTKGRIAITTVFAQL